MREVPIPNYVDSQMQIFFWEFDEFFPSLAIFVLLFLWDQTLLAIICSIAFTKVFSRFKDANMEGVLFHMAWWVGALDMNKRFASGLTREHTS